MKLFEAFEALDALNEETFAVSDDGVEKLDTFMQDNEDSDDIVDVIDPEAETEEDIQDSYVGKVILDCSVCHSKIYKDKTEVTIDEEQQLANVGEDCPYCYTSDGFKVIGEVAPFADKDEDTVDVKEEEEEVVEESLTEAVGTLEKPMSAFAGTLSNVMTAHQSELANVGSKVEALAFLDSIEPEVKNKGYLATVKEKVAKLPDFKVLTFLYNIILKGDGMGSKLESLTESHRGDRHRVTAELFDILSENGFDTDAEDVEDYVFAARDLVFEEVLSDPSKSIREIVEQWFEDTKVNYPEDLEALTRFEEGIFGIKTKKEKGKEAKAKAEKERQKQRDKELKDQEERARQQSVADSWARNDRAKRDAEKEYNRSRSTTQSSRVSNTGKAGVHYSGGDYYSEGLNESKSIKESIGFKAIKKGKKVNESWEDELEDAEYDEWFMDNLYNEFSNIAFELVEKEGYTDVFTEPSTQMGEGEDFFWAEKDGKSYCGSYDFQSEQDAFWECAANSGSREEAIQNCAKKYAEIILSSLELDEDEDELTESKSIKEDINNLSLDTDDTHMEMTSDETGKVTITTEPIETVETSDEVIVPVSDETVSEIENNNFENEEDVDFEEFDETSFDELGESYLKESFNNVVAFRTNEVIMSGDDLIVEGLIKFDSGNVKKTSFTFTAKDFLKEGLYRFVGKNNQLVESNSFELVGKIKDTKFICESLTEVK